MEMTDDAKQKVHDFWNKAACGESLYLSATTAEAFSEHARIRYALEPEILSFAQFGRTRGLKVLEIGVGLGADHSQFAQAGADLDGIDLTERAVDFTRRRLAILGLNSRLQVGDCENLPFADNTFDMVYSWGVLHVSPDTPRAVREVCRVLKPGGRAKIMIYHKYSCIGFMLWVRYALLRFRPWTSLRTIYANYLESPGTKAYSRREARAMFRDFENVTIRTQVAHGDLLTSQAGQRHEGILLRVARRIWPRWFIRRFMKKWGLEMMIEAVKPDGGREAKGRQ